MKDSIRKAPKILFWSAVIVCCISGVLLGLAPYLKAYSGGQNEEINQTLDFITENSSSIFWPLLIVIGIIIYVLSQLSGGAPVSHISGTQVVNKGQIPVKPYMASAPSPSTQEASLEQKAFPRDKEQKRLVK